MQTNKQDGILYIYCGDSELRTALFEAAKAAGLRDHACILMCRGSYNRLLTPEIWGSEAPSKEKAAADQLCGIKLVVTDQLAPGIIIFTVDHATVAKILF